MNIPGYSIEQEIGRGGMATVYRAVQESLHRTVALKVMAPALAADANFGERFLREARTAASLSHPGILSIYDVGVVGHNYYLTMEYIPGGDLKQRIIQGIPPAEVLAIVKQIAIALGHAHGKGFVHRDVKPENILFREDGTPVLVDFGIAKALGSGTRMTGTGMSIGTPHYMSPEQVRGKDVDGRSDLYSLGVLLYEALTGRLPYDGDDAFAIGIAHINDPIPVLPHCIGKIQILIDKLLAKDPSERHGSSAELCRSIDELLSGSRLPSEAESNSWILERGNQAQHTVVNTYTNEPLEPHSVDRFVDNGNGTVTDTSTGLVWQKKDDGIERTWQEAIEYSSSLRLGGSSNWRLPTTDELKELTDLSRKPAINPIFVSTKASNYWSALTDSNNPYNAWNVNFNLGSLHSYSRACSFFVRCVHRSMTESRHVRYSNDSLKKNWVWPDPFLSAPKSDEYVETYDNKGRTELMNAVIEGRYEEVERLVFIGADPQLVDNQFGTTNSIDLAARQKENSDIHKKIYYFLLDTVCTK